MGVADYFRLNTQEAADVLAQVTSAVEHWRATAASHGLRQAEIEAMAPAFEHAERDRAHAIAKSRSPGTSAAGACSRNAGTGPRW